MGKKAGDWVLELEPPSRTIPADVLKGGPHQPPPFLLPPTCLSPLPCTLLFPGQGQGGQDPTHAPSLGLPGVLLCPSWEGSTEVSLP